MISGTDIRFGDANLVPWALTGQRHRIASVDEIEEIRAKCEAEQALCLFNDDGIVVVEVVPYGEELELFVWVAVAFKHGAFERQEPALRAIAHDLGVKTIAFQTRRTGWRRRLGPAWQRRGTTEFVRRVDE